MLEDPEKHVNHILFSLTISVQRMPFTIMTSQSAESDYSFPAFPPPHNSQFAHNQWIPRTTSSSRPSCIDTIIGEVKHEFNHLNQVNQTLTNNLQQLHEKNDKLFQTLQRKEQCLHAAQQRIEELKQEVDRSMDIAERMQNCEGRLAACEHDISMYQQSFKENLQPTLDLNAGRRIEEQRCVPHLRRSGRSTSWKVELSPSQRSPRQVQQPAVEQKPQLDRRD
jgi:peptidoglycan hydrolase CwlO-like protein